MGNQKWMVAYDPERYDIVHVAPFDDTHEHVYNDDGMCWCGAWIEAVEGGSLIHHLNLTERLSVAGNAERIG